MAGIDRDESWLRSPSFLRAILDWIFPTSVPLEMLPFSTANPSDPNPTSLLESE